MYCGHLFKLVNVRCSLIAAIQSRNNPVDFPFHINASMSARFAAVVKSLSSRVEQYSIDELFVDCRGMETVMSLEGFGHQLRREVQRHTTLTCGVGVSFTKTLAKLCNHAAKTWPATGGVVALTDERRLHRGSTPEPPKFPLPQFQPGNQLIQVNNFIAALEGVMPVQQNVLPGHWRYSGQSLNALVVTFCLQSLQ